MRRRTRRGSHEILRQRLRDALACLWRDGSLDDGRQLALPVVATRMGPHALRVALT